MDEQQDNVRDIHVRITAVLFLIAGVFLSLFVVLVPAAALRMWLDPMPEFHENLALNIFVFSFSFCLGLAGVGLAVVGRGLWKGRRWAWVGGVAGGAVFALGGMLPIAGYALFSMLRPEIREAFHSGDEAPDRSEGVWLWTRVYFVLVALIYLGIAAGVVGLAVSNADLVLPGVFVATLCVVFALAYLLMTKMPRRPWAWWVTTCVLAIGSVGVMPPAAIPLLVFWVRSEQKHSFGITQ